MLKIFFIIVEGLQRHLQEVTQQIYDTNGKWRYILLSILTKLSEYTKNKYKRERE